MTNTNQNMFTILIYTGLGSRLAISCPLFTTCPPMSGLTLVPARFVVFIKPTMGNKHTWG